MSLAFVAASLIDSPNVPGVTPYTQALEDACKNKDISEEKCEMLKDKVRMRRFHAAKIGIKLSDSCQV